MKALILAAGLGTRLRPLTDMLPKALVEVDGMPIIGRLILKLKSQGFDSIVVNVHHFAGKIKDYLETHNFGEDIVFSDETDELLDTGGGILKAKELLFSDHIESVLVHNVDILSNADLKELMVSQKNREEGANLLVSSRESHRKLIFDSKALLKGWHDLHDDKYRPAGYKKNPSHEELAFSGIYTIGRKSVEEMEKIMGYGKFSIMEYFLHPERRQPVYGYKKEDLKLLDIGKPATLAQASSFLF